MDKTDIEGSSAMIAVNCGDNIFRDVILGLAAYEKYSIIDNIRSDIKQVFVADPIGIPIFHYSNRQAIIDSTSDIIIIDMITESYATHFYFSDYPKNKTYLLFSNGWWDESKVDLGFRYKLLHWNYFLYDYVKRATSSNLIDYFQDKKYNFNIKKEFEFTGLVGVIKEWRSELVTKLIDQIPYDNYILNYAGKDTNQNSQHLDINYKFNRFDSKSPIQDYFTLSSSIPIRIYDKTKVLLIAESTCSDFNEFHLTEKTIKALLTGIPFIIVGSYKFLEHLHNLGFKTFSDCWSEEYDNVSNPSDRIDEIVRVLKQIPSIEWNQNLIDKFEKIAYHNKTQLLNVNSIMKRQLELIVKQVEEL